MDPEEIPVDSTEVPTDAAPPGTGAEDPPAPDPPQSDPPAGDDAPKGFDGLFGAARAKAETTAPPSEEDPPATDPPAAESDDPIPDKEAAAKTDAEATSEADPKDAPKTDPPAGDKKTDRTRAYKEVVAENETLRTEHEAAAKRVTELDSQFEQHGGLDVVETAMSLYDKLATGQAVEVINELPPHEKAQVVEAIYQEAIADPANRINGINHVLKTDFGLDADVSQPVLEKIFEVITYKLNSDPSDFETYLDRELEFANTPERELARIKAENERLKTQPPADQKDTSAAESDFDFQVRVSNTHDAFEDTTFANVAAPEFKTYGLDVNPNDPPEIKEAKEFFQEAIKARVGFEMRTAKAFEPLLKFWVDQPAYEKSGKKLDEDSWYSQASKNYERAMRAKTQTALKQVSRLLGKTAAAPSPPADPKAKSTAATPPGQQTQIPAPGGRSAIQPQPAAPKKGGGFSAAFDSAAKTTGAR